MKQLVASKVVDIPSDVTFEVKARKVRVKGPRGEMMHSSSVGGLIEGRWKCAIS
jgi:ribosomal protein L6P/L9E